MVIDTKQLIEVVKRQNSHSFYIYDKGGELIFFNANEDESKVLKEIEYFDKNFPNGVWEITLMTGKTTQKHVTKFRWDNRTLSEKETPLNSNFESSEELRASIKKEIEQENRIKDLEQQIVNKDQDSEKDDHVTTLLNNSLEIIINKFLGAGAVKKTPLNNPGTQTKTISMDEVENALIVITKELGNENIIKLAQKIESGEFSAVKSIVVNFINQ